MKNTYLLYVLVACLLNSTGALIGDETLTQPIVAEDVVFEEVDGFVAVEAEYFFKQDSGKRAFYLSNLGQTPELKPDGDPQHVEGASNGCYIEILPDTRRNHSQKLIQGENFSNEPGKVCVAYYKVNFSNPGRYYVWVRAYSTGSEDNGIHVGVNGTWPKHGQRMQWCAGKRQWWWESKQRTQKEHCGVPYEIYLDIEKPGVHTIHFSMREDGFEFDKFIMTSNRDFARPNDVGPEVKSANKALLPKFEFIPAPKQQAGPSPTPADKQDKSTSPTENSSDKPLIMPRQPDGDGSLELTGQSMVWHKMTFAVNGPYAHELDNDPNPFADYRVEGNFIHDDGTKYQVPGFFDADGNPAETGSESGNIWKVHFTPDRAGNWKYEIQILKGKLAAIESQVDAKMLVQKSGSIVVGESDSPDSSLRKKGRLQYVGKRYLQHAGSGEYFLKAGADAPETLLAFADFDGTVANKPKKCQLKKYQAHLQDWTPGDPQWQGTKGRGLIGAINYLSGKGCNAFSFLTYNAGGDGDNVWPFVSRNDKLHYDCSKLMQWGIVFDHGTDKNMHLHFKLQETENDDHNCKAGYMATSLDGGNLGIQRKLYLKEIIARFGHNIALNWNLGEENTQTPKQQIAMIDYIRSVDPYSHPIVVHTFPDQQDKVYDQLIGDKSGLTGASLQNSGIQQTHSQTVKWLSKSAKTGRPWVITFDESGTAAHGVCPDLGYKGFDGKDNTGKYIYDQHAVRKATLWGTLMGGGAGVEYYFGYKFVENDLVCEDWRSRDQSWDYCRIALEFFRSQKIPVQEMQPSDELVGNSEHKNFAYCLAKPGDIYLVYIANGQPVDLKLEGVASDFELKWFDPKTGNIGESTTLQGDETSVSLKPETQQDWLAIVTRRSIK